MHFRVLASSFVTIGVALLLVVACARATPAPTPLPTPTMTAQQARDLLSKAALGFGDLSPGYELVAAGQYISNEEAGKISKLGQGLMLAKIEEWGRIIGYAVSYRKGSEILINTLDLYKDNSGALASLRWYPGNYTSLEHYLDDEIAHNLAGALGVAPSSMKVEVKQISFQRFGDDSIAISLSMSVGAIGRLEAIQVCEVKHSISGCVLLLSPGAEPGVLLQEIENVIRTMDRKLETIR
ncbi:MAG: hypothetical protein HYU29_01740 [Chloroflexi bacterium]|nr:hypothetical protein [Chloroflexota bacterium]